MRPNVLAIIAISMAVVGSESWARQYSSETGRYIQFDPIGLDDGPNGYIYVHGDPLRGTDPMGLANSAATFWMRGKEPPNKPKDSQMCENDHRCENTITLSVGGSCDPGDTMCVVSMQAAGIKGPYTREYKTYDLSCIGKLGLSVKGPMLAGGLAAQKYGPNAAARTATVLAGAYAGSMTGAAANTAAALAGMGRERQ